jgi:hypothetical protein
MLRRAPMPQFAASTFKATAMTRAAVARQRLLRSQRSSERLLTTRSRSCLDDLCAIPRAIAAESVGGRHRASGGAIHAIRCGHKAKPRAVRSATSSNVRCRYGGRQRLHALRCPASADQRGGRAGKSAAKIALSAAAKSESAEKRSKGLENRPSPFLRSAKRLVDGRPG